MSAPIPTSSHELIKHLQRNLSVEVLKYEIHYWTKQSGRRPKLLLLAPEHAERVRTHTDARLVFSARTVLGVPVKVWTKTFSSLVLHNGEVHEIM